MQMSDNRNDGVCGAWACVPLCCCNWPERQATTPTGIGAIVCVVDVSLFVITALGRYYCAGESVYLSIRLFFPRGPFRTLSLDAEDAPADEGDAANHLVNQR